MPVISRFLGIVIMMYYADHNPPHFHVKYNEHRAKFSIDDLRLMEGKLPPKVVSLVLEWAFQHRMELLNNWKLAIARKRLREIDPLV